MKECLGDVMKLVKNCVHENFCFFAENSFCLCYECIHFFKFENGINFKQTQKQVFESDP